MSELAKTGSKSGGSFCASADMRTMRFKRLSMVEMLRLDLSCMMRSSQTLASLGVRPGADSVSRLRARSFKTFRTRSCISVAAALVKVMAMTERQSSSGPCRVQAPLRAAPGLKAARWARNFCVRVQVLPEPAEALIWVMEGMGDLVFAVRLVPT